VRRMRRAGARQGLVWRLTRVPDGLLVTAYWHPRPGMARALAAPIRARRQAAQRSRLALGAVNRRRLYPGPAPHGAAPT
jgi:hypothetical protein